MRKLSFVFGVALLGLALSHTPGVFAGDKPAADDVPPAPKIEMTGIAQFDDVFGKAKDIHTSLDTETASLKTARATVNTELGLAQDSPFKNALDDLKKKGAGKIKVAMNGTVPHLQPSDAVPDNVQKGIDAINKLTDATDHAITTGKGLVPQAQQLATAAAAFPGQLTSLGLDPMKLAKATKTVTADVKAVGATPQRIDAMIKICEGIFTDLKGAFAG